MLRPGRAGIVTILAGWAMVVALGGCSSIGNALGFSKRPPDEFEVLAKAPLVVPPDYNLRPPADDELSLRERNPQEMAQRALFPPREQSQMPALEPGDVGVSPLAPRMEERDIFSDDISGDDPFN